MTDKIVLFGAGVYAKKYKSLLDFLDISFDYFTDNDASKFGMQLYGKKVIPPIELVGMDCKIIISCTHGELIKKQLIEMGIANKILELEELYSMFANRVVGKAPLSDNNTCNGITIIIDMYEGIGWGGTEIWASNVACNLKAYGENVLLVGSTEQIPMEPSVESMTKRFGNEDTIEKMVSEMLCNLPFVLLNNFSGCVYLAAVLIKMQFPDQVFIIDVIHNDNKSLFDAHMMFQKWVDAFMCVSNRIREKIILDYHIPDKRVYFKEQPIETEKGFHKEYNETMNPLRIGYAARIVRQQKRTDLFPALLTEMEKRQIHYSMEVAGEGECLAAIRDYIELNNLQQKVKLLGRIDKSKMNDFWKSKDIFLNFSEYEGTSLSMLEAMGYACIPVVTDVSGVSEFITNSENGFVSEVGNLKDIADNILYLDRNRNKLHIFGEKCRTEIIRRCNQYDYTKYIYGMIQDVVNGKSKEL